MILVEFWHAIQLVVFYFQPEKLGCIIPETGCLRAWKSFDLQDAHPIKRPNTFLICYSTTCNYYDPPIRFQELDYSSFARKCLDTFDLAKL